MISIIILELVLCVRSIRCDLMADPLHGCLPAPFVPYLITRRTVADHGNALMVERSRTQQFLRYFISLTVRARNLLPFVVIAGGIELGLA